MDIEKKYLLEYGNQVKKYLNTFGIIEEDLGKLTKSTSKNIKEIINGEVGLNLKKMINIANIFGVTHYYFSNPKAEVPPLKNLPEITKKKIAERIKKGITERDDEHLFSTHLDLLIEQKLLNKPKTSKIILANMSQIFSKKKSSEITSLLNNSPRNEYILCLDHRYLNQNIYIHIDYAHKYNNLTAADLAEIISKQEKELGLTKSQDD